MSNSAGFMTCTFVFIGKNINFVISCLQQPPLVAGATTFAPLGSVSLDSQSPKGSLRIQFSCHAHFVVGLWMLGSGGNLSLWQQRRENHTTGLRPGKQANRPAGA